MLFLAKVKFFCFKLDPYFQGIDNTRLIEVVLTDMNKIFLLFFLLFYIGSCDGIETTESSPETETRLNSQVDLDQFELKEPEPEPPPPPESARILEKIVTHSYACKVFRREWRHTPPEQRYFNIDVVIYRINRVGALPICEIVQVYTHDTSLNKVLAFALYQSDYCIDNVQAHLNKARCSL